MVNPKKPDGSTTHALVPTPTEYPRPAIAEPVVGEYYGRIQTKSARARSYLQLLRRQRGMMLFVFIAVMGIGLAWLLTRAPLYRAVAEMLVTPIERSSGRDANLAGEIDVLTRMHSVATEVKVLNSPDLLDVAFAGLAPELRRKGFRTQETKLAHYPIAIRGTRDTDIIAIEVTARDPAAAAAFANQVVATSLTRRQETTREIARLATQHVSAELQKCDTTLRHTWNELSAYKRAHGIVEINTDAVTAAQGLATLESQATMAEVDMARAQMTRRTLAEALRKEAPTVVAQTVMADNPVILTIDAEIERLQGTRASLLQDFLPTAPEVRAIDNQIAEAKARKEAALTTKAITQTHAKNPLIDNMATNYINALVAEQESKSRLAITRATAVKARGRIANLPASEERVALLSSRITELQNTHTFLSGQLQALTLSMQGGLPNIMPITTARPNYLPISPNVPASVLLLLVLASLLAIGVAVLRDQLDERMHTTDMLESMTGHRVLTSIPYVRNGFHGLVSQSNCPAQLLESFRILRGQVLLSMLDPLPRAIMVTSPQAGDGKSTVCANLASTIAMSGKNVLVIDCDMRHPSLHIIHRKDNTRGLSTVLQGQDDLEQCLQATEIPHLHVLTAGPPATHPPELLASPMMTAILTELRERYDCILLDSTPMVHLSDGTVLASLSEGVIVVVSSDRTREPELRATLRTLEQIGAPLLGLVHNRSEESPAIGWSRERSA